MNLTKEGTSLSLVIVVVGAAGTGKSTLAEAATRVIPSITKLVSATTRPPRAGEVDGFDKRFLDPARFAELVASGELSVPTETYGNRYALRVADLRSPGITITEMHFANLEKLRTQHSELESVCVLPRSAELAVAQIGSRGESAAEIATRRALILGEHEQLSALARSGVFEHVLINDYDERSKERFVNLLRGIVNHASLSKEY